MSEFTRLQRKQAGYHSSVFSTPDSSPTTLHVASVPTIGHDFSKISILPKLEVSQPNDPAEQEADRVAAEVVNQIHAPQPSPIQRQETLEKEDEEELQMKPIQRVVNQEEMSASPDLETSIAQAKGGGQPLDQTIRAPIEQVMGADLSEVKVHTDAQADQLNRSVQARAFTTGQDVFFRQGEYNPGSRGGQELIAHELTHVVQQNGEGIVQRQLKESETKGVFQDDKYKGLLFTLNEDKTSDHGENVYDVTGMGLKNQTSVTCEVGIIYYDIENGGATWEPKMEGDETGTVNSTKLYADLNRIAEKYKGERCHECATDMQDAFKHEGLTTRVYDIGDEGDSKIWVMEALVRNHYVNVYDGYAYDSSTGGKGVLWDDYFKALSGGKNAELKMKFSEV